MITRKHVALSSFSTFLSTYLPITLSQHLLSAMCNTSFRRKTGLHPDYFQPHTAQQESTNISCTILSFHSHQQTIISDKCKTLLQSISTKQSKIIKKKLFSTLPTYTKHLNTVNQTLPTHTPTHLVKGYNTCLKANREADDGMRKGTDFHVTAWEGLAFGKVRKELFRDRGGLKPPLMLPSLQEGRIVYFLWDVTHLWFSRKQKTPLYPICHGTQSYLTGRITSQHFSNTSNFQLQHKLPATSVSP